MQLKTLKATRSLTASKSRYLDFPQTKKLQIRLIVNFFQKTAEATFEVVFPDFIKTFQQSFLFVITEKILNLSNFKIHALENHFKSENCFFQLTKKKFTITTY